MRILCPEPSSFSVSGLEMAASRCTLVAENMNQMEFEAAAPDFDTVLIRFNTRVSGALMERSTRLKAVMSPTTGLDHIDMAAARRLGVKVYHLRGQKRFLKNVSATAELALTHMLSLLRHLPSSVEATRQGHWDPAPFRGREAAGKILGIVGCGRLGTKITRYADALGMKLVVFDPFVKRLPARAIRAATLHELLSQVDIVTLHVPLNDATVHMIGAEEFACMKDGALLVNTSRGAIVNSDALLAALRRGKLAAAGLDVVENEELILQGRPHSLIEYAREHSNLIITPHIGGATYESVEKTDAFIIQRYLNDQELRK